MSKPHPLSEVIHAFAEGKTIQIMVDGAWEDRPAPSFNYLHDPQWWRVKPEKAHPTSTMRIDDLKAMGCKDMEFTSCGDEIFGTTLTITRSRGGPRVSALTEIANAALRHAIDAHQVVTADEHQAGLDRLAHNLRDVQIERHKMRDLAVALAVQSVCVSKIPGPADRRAILDIDLASIVASIG